MKRYRTLIRTIPLLVASGLLLSACAAYPEPYATAYGYDDSAYAGPGYGFGWWGGLSRGFDHDHGFHNRGLPVAHTGGLARGRGFAQAGGFHGGGGMHGGGGHRG